MEWMTTGQMIDRLEVGEIAENEHGVRVCYYHDVLKVEGTQTNLYILSVAKLTKW